MKRQACPEDRRGAFAALTEAGEAAHAPGARDPPRQLAELLDGALDPDEELVLVSALRKLRDRVNPEASFLTALERDPEAGDDMTGTRQLRRREHPRGR